MSSIMISPHNQRYLYIELVGIVGKVQVLRFSFNNLFCYFLSLVSIHAVELMYICFVIFCDLLSLEKTNPKITFKKCQVKIHFSLLKNIAMVNLFLSLSGRVARAGQSGTAYSFLCKDEVT